MQALLSPKTLRLQVFWLIGRILSKINCKTQKLQEDQIADQVSMKEFVDPFTGSKNTKA